MEEMETMDFLTGKTEKETLDISDILAGEYEGKDVRVNGAIYTIRDMGDVAFIILRKREGLVQTVYEEGVTAIPLKELCEEAAVEITGTVTAEERAPHGFEIRLKEVRVLSRPVEPMPVVINKWKMNTSLETKLDLPAASPEMLSVDGTSPCRSVADTDIRFLHRFAKHCSTKNPDLSRLDFQFLKFLNILLGTGISAF